MDLKQLASPVLYIILVISRLVAPVWSECIPGYLWSEVRQSCVHCFDACGHSRNVDCMKRCFESAASLSELQIAKMSVLRRRKRDDRQCGTIICEKFYYCDQGVRKCSSCHIICQSHEIQDTTEQCNKLCPDFLENEENRKNADQEKTVVDDKSDDDDDDAIITITSAALSLTALIALVVVVAVVIRYRKKVCKCSGSSLNSNADKKRSIPCSQESDIANSKTPLTRQTGPIAEEKHFPQMETAAEEYKGNLGEEMGFPEIACAYRVVDGHSSHSTEPKTPY